MFASLRVTKLIGALGIVAMFGMTGSASGAITGSLHDLSQNQSGTEVCVYCHTPHNANTQAAPLWNRLNSTGPNYNLYLSSTLDTPSVQPVGISQACLSCHDGVMAFNALTNGGAADAAALADNTAKMGEAGYDTVNSLINDLSNQHPVSITLPVTGEFETAATINGVVGGAVIYNGEVECGSCHDPHDADATKFLRVDNADSDLCLSCHIK